MIPFDRACAARDNLSLSSKLPPQAPLDQRKWGQREMTVQRQVIIGECKSTLFARQGSIGHCQKRSLDAGSSFWLWCEITGLEQQSRAVWGLSMPSAPIGGESPYAVQRAQRLRRSSRRRTRRRWRAWRTGEYTIVCLCWGNHQLAGKRGGWKI